MSCCNNGLRRGALAAVLAFAGFTAGCSDLYYDRREAILFGAQDAVATNVAIHTIDPWPPAAANRNIPGHGPNVAIAQERYRTGRVIKPQGLGTTSTYKQSQTPDGAPTVAAQSSGGAAVKD